MLQRYEKNVLDAKFLTDFYQNFFLFYENSPFAARRFCMLRSTQLSLPDYPRFIARCLAFLPSFTKRSDNAILQ